MEYQGKCNFEVSDLNLIKFVSSFVSLFMRTLYSEDDGRVNTKIGIMAIFFIFIFFNEVPRKN